MKRYFGYVRVSDPKQKTGVSPEVQRSDIGAFAQRREIEIVEWFVEVQTAAKVGRSIFLKMLSRLEKGDAEGVIFHKIDRSARNLDDWNKVGKLFDRGIDVQFAHESIDLGTRGGRLSADIMAVVAADYIRNLREEARKGLYGRLKQGIYPLAAPIGYLDRGKGNLKTLDPERAALVLAAFERYATGSVGLRQLRDEMLKRGLRTKSGRTLSVNCLSRMLNNPFYTGILHLRTSGESFEGKHTPLVTKAMFDRVQAILSGKTVLVAVRHDFLFRKRVHCGSCGRHLIGERQKGHVYYRCHACRGVSAREELIEDVLVSRLKRLCGDKREIGELRQMAAVERRRSGEGLERLRASIELLIAKCDDRLARLTDALIDQLLDKNAFETRKARLLNEKRALRDRHQQLSPADLPAHRAFGYVELSNAAYSGYISGNGDERRRIFDQVTSNLSLSGKNPAITLKSPFQQIVEWRDLQKCALARGTPRTRAKELLDIIKLVAQQ